MNVLHFGEKRKSLTKADLNTKYVFMMYRVTQTKAVKAIFLIKMNMNFKGV